MKATDLPLLCSVSRPTLHPDGSRVVVAVSRPDFDADGYVGQLWSVPVGSALSGSIPQPQRITRGTKDSSPMFSPDGRMIAFLRAPAEGAAQLHVVDSAGGEPIQVTDRKLGIEDFRWSPDSRRLAFTSRVPEQGRYGTVAELGPDAEAPRRISTLNYLSNGEGYITDRRIQVFVVDVPEPDQEPHYAAAPRIDRSTPEQPSAIPKEHQLTFGDFDHGAFAFAPDGQSLAVVSARHDSRDTDLRTDIWSISLAPAQGEGPTQGEGTAEVGGTDDAERLTPARPVLDILAVDYADDGTLFFLAADLGEHATDFIGRAFSLYLLDASDEQPTRLTDASLDLEESHLTIDGARVLVQNRTRGHLELLAVARDGDVTALATGELEVTGHDAVGDTVVVSFRTPHRQGDIGVVERGTVRALSNFSRPLRDAGLVDPVEFTATAPDGYPVHGWVLEPDAEGPHPALLMIHGGPFTQYGSAVFDEAQVLVDAGYLVLMCNPRGAAGYGEDHARAILGAMGTVDLTDVLAFVNGAIEAMPSIDPERLGILGGSYGGYLTAWTIAHDHRFVAAIVERGFLDPVLFDGTSDIGSFFGQAYAGTDPDLVRAQSPQAVVGQVTTPTLVIHSAEDLRCPLSQGERYFAALKRQGVPTELLIFPGENHELTRSGRPRHRLQRFEAVLEWWSRYLPTPANPRRAAGRKRVDA
ncbi:S9 family peptidase [soil metagenome]